MPNLGPFHPQIIHFVVVLLLVGVALRCLSVVVRRPFITTAATLCLVFGTVATWFAVRSGTNAHGPVERIPGVRDAVEVHEDGGKLVLNIFYAVVALELVGLAVASKTGTKQFTRWVHVGSAVVGLYGAVELYNTAKHGGDLVYSYAGGPGLRTGNPEDVDRLLIAGLYNQSMADRKAGRSADAAALIDQLAQRMPKDAAAQLLRVESLVVDRKQYAAAIAFADSIPLDTTNLRLRSQLAMLKTDAYVGLGQLDSARAVLSAAVAAIPTSRRLKARLDSLK